LRLYRKDVDFKGNTAHAYHEAWRERGWTGTGSVVRVEFEVHRRWLSKQREEKIEVMPNGEEVETGRFLDTLAADELFPLVGDVWRRLTGGCYPNELWPRDRKDKKRAGPWDLIRLAEWSDESGREIRRQDRCADVERALRNIRAAHYRAERILGSQQSSAEYADLAHGEQYEDEKAAWSKRSRWALSDCGHKIDSPIDMWLEKLRLETSPVLDAMHAEWQKEREECAGLPGFEPMTRSFNDKRRRDDAEREKNNELGNRRNGNGK
jgi:hypothetical protein